MRQLTDAIVIRRARYSETSQIVDLLTADEGRVTALARGSYRKNSAFGGPLDLLTRGAADLARRKNSGLALLHGFRITSPYRELRSSLGRWLAACHGLELVRLFAWPRNQERELFASLARLLEVLAKTSDDVAVETWQLALSARMLEVAGFQPQLENCAGCGAEIHLPDNGVVQGAFKISFARGGALCARCDGLDKNALPCSAGAMALLRRVLGSGQSLSGPAALGETDLNRARAVLDTYLEYRLERPLLARRLFDRPGFLDKGLGVVG